MFNQSQPLFVIILLLGSLVSPLLTANDTIIQLGRALSDAEAEKYAITIYPDGTNLPLGQGSVLQGEVLYNNQCKMCHGVEGIEGPAARLVGSDGWGSLYDPLRVFRIKKYPILLISVGGLWPYATTVYDYIRRAMPHYAPKSLTNDEVYALTAYILHLNDLLDEDAILNKVSILEVVMPGKDRSISLWKDTTAVRKDTTTRGKR